MSWIFLVFSDLDSLEECWYLVGCASAGICLVLFLVGCVSWGGRAQRSSALSITIYSKDMSHQHDLSP